MDMMKALMEGMMASSSWSPKGTAEEMTAAVDAAAEKLMNRLACPFNIGDHVTPKKNSDQKGRGVPHKVVEVFDSRNVRRHDGNALKTENMTVAFAFPDGDAKLFYDDSEEFELFDPSKVKTEED